MFTHRASVIGTNLGSLFSRVRREAWQRAWGALARCGTTPNVSGTEPHSTPLLRVGFVSTETTETSVPIGDNGDKCRCTRAPRDVLDKSARHVVPYYVEATP